MRPIQGWEAPRTAARDGGLIRAGLAERDDAWHGLSPAARRAFVAAVAPVRDFVPPEVWLPNASWPAGALDELGAARLVIANPLMRKGQSATAKVAPSACDFAARIHVLARTRLLYGNERDALAQYVRWAFRPGDVWERLRQVAEAGGVNGYDVYHDLAQEYIPGRYWPGWVAARLKKEALPRALLDALRAGPGPVPLADLPALVGKPADKTRAALDKLIELLAVFEDLHPDSADLMIGLLPAVRKALADAEKPRVRPPLPPHPEPTVLAPDGGVEMADLRAFLLELAVTPARLKQGGGLYRKEVDRIAPLLEPLPAALAAQPNGDAEHRVDRAAWWANTLRLARQGKHEGNAALLVAPAGRAWLALPMDEQHAAVFAALRDVADAGDPYGWHGSDYLFLPTQVVAVPGKEQAYGKRRDDRQREELRAAVYAAFLQLPLGTFVRRIDFLAHAAYGTHNPVLLGRKPGEVSVRRYHRQVPPLEEALDKAGRELLDDVLRERLIPFGAVQYGLDADKAALIARTPRLDVYFGHEPEAGAAPPRPAEVGRVVVQPDFTVVVIGRDAGPAAELLPFCERGPGSVAQGSLTLRLTREAVLRAVAAGLKDADILGRLERHVKGPLPRNVVTEVRGWCGLVRRLKAATVTLLRCPDRDAADRALGVLGKQAERLSDTVLAVDEPALSSALKRKLQAQGLLVGTARDEEDGARRKKKK